MKPQHTAQILGHVPGADRGGPLSSALSFLEVHPQNYVCAGGPPHRALSALAEHFPLSFHSVGLSLGRAQGLDADELDQLAALVERYRPAQVSDHLAWCSGPDERFPDLLPLPMTVRALETVAGEVGRVQDRLKQPILVENPSRMLAFQDDAFDEAEFLNALSRRTGCGILLDINNIEVSALNLGLSPWDYVERIDLSRVGEIHMAGHALEHHESGPLAIDDHGSNPTELGWCLFEDVIARAGPIATLIEWDTDVPPFETLEALAARAADVLSKHQQGDQKRGDQKRGAHHVAA